MKSTISIIAAIAEKNRAIGKDNKLLWHIPEDLRRFKNLTTGHAIIMGQKTFESLGKPLPNRTNIVISNNPDFNPQNVIVTRSIEESLKKAREIEKEEIFICGGGLIYRQFLLLADKLYLTIIEGNFEADTFFPDYSEFSKIVKEEKSSDEKYNYKFVELVRE
ncbi:MAG: dihydrofolate reductase [Candidatus Moranbacteria bacterium]|nr:dihydrofolate reductase [Candidatus Moranbacteria bacterium]